MNENLQNNTWYGTCSTAAATTEKVVTTASGNFELKTGSIVYVLFTYASCANATLNVDGKGAKTIKIVGNNNVSTYHWALNEVVGFVYDGTYFRILDGQVATTTYYGVTKLSSSTSSTSTTAAATPSAVKAAYDLANTANTVSATAQTRADEAYDLADSKADIEHEHTISDIADLTEATRTTSGLLSAEDKTQLDNGGIKTVNMSSDDGAVWTATIDGVEELTAGMTFLFVPNRTSSSTSLTLNVNGLGAVAVRRKLSSGTATLSNPTITTQFFANRPVLLMYDTATVNGTPYWIALEFTKPSATDLYGKVPVQNGGWFSNSNTTDDDLVEAREAFGVYSKADHNWVQIYDSGATTEQINSFANINISGYKKIMMAIKCVNDTTNASTTRYGSAIFKATNGTTYQFPVFNSMFFGSETTTASIGFFEFIDGWIVCPQVVRSIKYSDFLTSTEGGTCTNMNNMGSGLMKCTNPLSTVTVSSLDQNADFFFGVGSRVIVWGSVI